MSAEILAAVAACHWCMEGMNNYKQYQNANRVPVAFTVPTRSYYHIMLSGWDIYTWGYISSHVSPTGSTPSVFFLPLVISTEIQNINVIINSFLFCFSSST